MSHPEKNPYHKMQDQGATTASKLELVDAVGTGIGMHEGDLSPRGSLADGNPSDTIVQPYPGSYRIEHRKAPLEDPLLVEIKRNEKEYRTPIFGDVIPEGKVGFWLKNGKMGVVSPGRRMILDPLKKLVAVVSASDNIISFDQLAIIRIQPGQIGLAFRNGVPVILEEGRHWLEAPEWKYVGAKDSLADKVQWSECPSLCIVRVAPGRSAFVSEDNVPRVLPARTEPYELMAPAIKFVKFIDVLTDINSFDSSNSLDIVRVRPGKLALAWENGQPVVLRPRENPYVLRAPAHQFVALHDEMAQVVRLDEDGTLDLVRVRPGQVGLYWEDGCNPKVCQPASEPYVFMKPKTLFVGVVEITQEHIELGSLHLVTIPTGRRGVVWERGVARIVESGQYVINEQNFKFGGSHDLSEKHYQLGPFTYVTVEGGEVGVKHRKGSLEILQPGTHCIAAQDGDTFAGFVSVQQQVMLVTDLTVTTLDNVDLKVNAVLTYNISDPIKAIQGVKNLDEVLRQRTETTLSNIFSHHNYGDKAAQAAHAMFKRDSAEEEGDQSLAVQDDQDTLTTQVHVAFMGAMSKTAEVWWGVNIEDLSVDNIKIVNADLRSDLEQRAVTTVKTETARANAENASQVDLIKAQADAKAKTLQAQGETAKLLAESRAQLEITKQTAIVQAEAMRVEAESKAKVARIMAAAEAEAMVLKAEAQKKAMELEAEGAEKLGENALRMRMWEAQCRIAAEMFRNQRTFIDTNGLPTMSQMLNMSVMNQLGLDMPTLKPKPRSNSVTRGNKVDSNS